jgi:O-antigen/teichoic acid export membrane protein
VQVTIAHPSAPSTRGVRRYLHSVRSDSLVRNSLYLMLSTVVTSGLGYIFWIIAAHVFTRQQVGIGSAVISLCSTAALLTYLGSSAMLIERLPAREGSSQWTAILLRVCLITAAVTAVGTAAAVPLLLTSKNYSLFFSAAPPIFVAVVGAAVWTVVNLLGASFIASRRAGRLLSIQTVVSVTKVLFVLPLAAAGAGAMGLVEAWVASAALGVCAGAVWLVPRMELGRRPGFRPRRRAEAPPEFRSRRYARPRHRRGLVPPSADSVRHWIGQHLTSAGGILIPLLLPVLVVLRLGVTQNAYFYVTEMMGAAFFMVSPSVASAVFAEGVRAHSHLERLVSKSLRIIAVLLAPAVVVMVVAGRFILGLFGASYAAAGYGLLILLALSALPDAVSNVAVVVCRVTRRLEYSSALNIAILVMTLAGSWVLMPPLGIAGVGLAWLAAQTVGAIASFPIYAQMRKHLTLDAMITGRGHDLAEEEKLEPDLDVGRALEVLIDLAELQSVEQFRR